MGTSLAIDIQTQPALDSPDRDELLATVESYRREASEKIMSNRRAALGQFLTPSPIASLMAQMLFVKSEKLRLLDPGAGVGSLTAAVTSALCQRPSPPQEIHAVAYEIDSKLVGDLERTMVECARACKDHGIRFSCEVHQADFIAAGADLLHERGLFESAGASFDAVIVNPPYMKFRADSRLRRLLRETGIETSNMYTAFVWLALKLLSPVGELVCITPRSFCNGPYFTPFRRFLAATARLRRIHIFESRKKAFAGDDVLQENIIMHAYKGAHQGKVVITKSDGPSLDDVCEREVDHCRVVRRDDPMAMLHIALDELDDRVTRQVTALPATLADLGLTVSTGRVVDFRATHLLRSQNESGTVPLIYPVHFENGFIRWPRERFKKPQAISVDAAHEGLLLPTGYYVLTKRFSAKEQPRRIMAAISDPKRVPCKHIAFENHVNFFHQGGRGLSPELAKGLTVFLNSGMVDLYFRQFNGHTQVNATDLRAMRYPSLERLVDLGRDIGDTMPHEEEIDKLVRERIFDMARKARRDPVLGKRRIKQALAILKSIGVPRAQQNERSALALLGLADMKPNSSWSDAAAPLRGITELMDYFRDYFGKKYAPNTRETVRRFTVHQFVQMGIIIANPDDPARAVNSPDNRYQLDAAALKLLRTFATPEWDSALGAYLTTSTAIRRLTPDERPMCEIPVTLPDGSRLSLSAGGQNPLVKKVIEDFCSRFTPGGTLVYVGDAGDKWKHCDVEYLARLGVTIDEHGKMPDLVVHYTAKNWLVLIEAVTSHGPVNLKRLNELRSLFSGSQLGFVFVTAFMTRRELLKYLGEIAWETEVWVAESPTHMIHFNGERFLGPYQ